MPPQALSPLALTWPAHPGFHKTKWPHYNSFCYLVQAWLPGYRSPHRWKSPAPPISHEQPADTEPRFKGLQIYSSLPCVPGNAQISAQPVPSERAIVPHLGLAEGSLAHSSQPSSAGESPRDRLLSDGCASEQEPWSGATRSDQSYPLSTALSQLLLRGPV